MFRYFGPFLTSFIPTFLKARPQKTLGILRLAKRRRTKQKTGPCPGLVKDIKKRTSVTFAPCTAWLTVF